MLAQLWRDARESIRGLTRSPVYTLTALLSLAVGVGANAAVFAVVDSILMRPLPYRTPERLVSITQHHEDPLHVRDAIAIPWIELWREQSKTVEEFGVYNVAPLTLVADGGVQLPVSVYSLSHNLFRLLGTSSLSAGRLFTDEDDRAGAPFVAIISHPLRDSLYGGQYDVIGQRLRIASRIYTIVGVMQEGFRFPESPQADVFVPIALAEQSRLVRTAKVIARLRADVQLHAAQDELAAMAARVVLPAVPSGSRPSLQSLRDKLAGNLKLTLPIVFVIAVLVLCLACANLATMMLTRTVARTPELALRLAVGGTPRKLAQLVLVENLLVTGAGLVLALFCARVVLGVAKPLLSQHSVRADGFVIDGRILVVTTAIAVITGLLSSSLAFAHVVRASSSGLREFSNGVMQPRARDRARQAIVAVQVALALPILVGTLLLLRTFWNLSEIELGFIPRNVLTFKLPMLGSGYTNANRLSGVNAFLERIRSEPNVRYAGGTTALPLAGNQFRFAVGVEGEAATTDQDTAVDVVSPGYFQAVGVRFLRGRDFEDRDVAAAAQVAIVNESFVRRRFRSSSALGHRIILGGPAEHANIAIVGVVADIREGNPRNAAEAKVYRPLTQAAPQLGWHTLSIAIRVANDPSSLVSLVRFHLSQVAKESTAFDFAMMQDRLDATVTSERHRATMFGTFSAIAFLLLAVGVYGITSYYVERAMREFGVRVALGASRSELRWVVTRYSMAPVFFGLGIGLILSTGASQALAFALYGVSTHDVLTFSAAAAACLLAAFMGSFFPTRHALSVDPAILLKSE